MMLLSSRYSLIGMDRLVHALTSGDWSDVPNRAVAVTLDDGHSGNYELLGAFQRYGVKPTVYLCTRIVDTNRHYWWTAPRVDERRLKRIGDSDDFWRALEQEYAFSGTHEFEGDERPQGLSRAEIEEMKGHADFGAHGLFHVPLPMCSDEEAMTEIGVSRSEVEALTGGRCDHFSYPNGDFTARDCEFVKKAGFLSGRTTQVGWVAADSDSYRLPIIAMPHESSANRLAPL